MSELGGDILEGMIRRRMFLMGNILISNILRVTFCMLGAFCL